MTGGGRLKDKFTTPDGSQALFGYLFSQTKKKKAKRKNKKKTIKIAIALRTFQKIILF